MCEIDIGNPKYTTFTKLVQVRNFIHLFEFKGFSTWGERDTIFLCWLLLHRQLSKQTTRGARSAQICLASASLESQPSSSEAGIQLTAFSQIPKSSAHASGHDVIQLPSPISYLGIFILTSVNDASSSHAREHLRSCLHLTNPCAKWKVLSLTKPKGQIYKTKSLGNYITTINVPWFFVFVLFCFVFLWFCCYVLFCFCFVAVNVF